jgi:hypothetical protein
MKTCPYCAHVNREGILFCEECGHPFVGEASVMATTQLVSEEQGTFQGRMTWGTARFSNDASLIVRIRDFEEPVMLSTVDTISIGRRDPNSSVEIDLDLVPYGAADLGVSRLHASIRRGEDTLTLVDENSTNGTYLNGQRLISGQPRVLRDGDEVRLGRLVFHVFFG